MRAGGTCPGPLAPLPAQCSLHLWRTFPSPPHPLSLPRPPHAQDLSIDVYGRKAQEEAAAKVAGGKAVAAADKAAEPQEDEADDMDALLSV